MVTLDDRAPARSAEQDDRALHPRIEGKTQTLPLVVYAQFEESLDASIAASAILVIAAFGVLVAVRMGRLRLLAGVSGP